MALLTRCDPVFGRLLPRLWDELPLADVEGGGPRRRKRSPAPRLKPAEVAGTP